MRKFFAKKQLKCFLLAVLFILSLVFVSGCVYSDHPNGGDQPGGKDDTSAYIGHINGFKVNYKPDIFAVNDFYANFSTDLVRELATMFGTAQFDTQLEYINSIEGEIEVVPFIYQLYLEATKDHGQEDEILLYKPFENNILVYFIDDIRNSVNLEEVADKPEDNKFFAKSSLASHSWNWTHKIDVENGNTYGYNLAGNQIQFAGVLFGQQITYPLTSQNAFLNLGASKVEKTLYYQEFFPLIYGPAMQVAVLEILLNRTPTAFAFDYSTAQVMPNPHQILGDGATSGLKLDYMKQAEYIGISQQDREEITDYLLDYVIGSAKYNSSDSYFKKQDYKFIIDTLIWQDKFAQYYFSDETNTSNPEPNQSLGSIYDVYPTTSLIDYPSTKLFVADKDGAAAFAHLPKGEIRSVILMPSQVGYLYELWFYLAADRAFELDLHYRYYDAETDTLFESNTKRVRTLNQNNYKFNTSNHISMNFYDQAGNEMLYKAQPFNNQIGDGVLNASTEKTMTYQLAQYFEPSSKGGFGLNHQKFRQDGSSFFEIVFSVPKAENTQDLDYNFKFAMLYPWFADKHFLG